VCAILVFFCVRWQVVEASRFHEISQSRTFSSELKSQRGAIYSKDGTTLAYSEPRFNMFVWVNDLLFFEKQEIQTREEFINKVSPIIEVTPEDLKSKIDSYYKQGILWIPIAQSLSKEQWQQLLELKTDKYDTKTLSGFIFESTSKRIYPEGRLASHIVGLTNQIKDKYVGVGGIEEAYDGVLNPITGFVTKETDAIGQTVTASLLPTIEPQNGSSIYTTIDKKLQEIAERKAKEGNERYEAHSTSILIMDPKTGSIMAMANYPDYDPNTREEEEAFVYGNRSTLSPFEAGSIGKTMTIATAMDLGLINADTIIQPNGHQGCEVIHKDLLPLCTWDKKPQPPLKAWECFYKSDNICFYHMAKLIDENDFYNYLLKFGVGKASGVDLGRGDSFGILKESDEWNEGDLAAFSYGHGYQVNMIQAADYTATVANYGVRMRPKVVDRIIDAKGNEKEFKPIVIERAIKKETADEMARLMNINFQKSVAANEYHFFDLLNYNIGVKSGTALIATEEGYTSDINATQIGFDASDERSFVMVVWLEKPQIPAFDRLSFYNSRVLWLETFAEIKDIIGVPRK
jgi:cell division protein FtsI/penicillin-binding protein 2